MRKDYTVYDCNILYFPKISNRAGNITVVENLATIPFSVKRVYYLYDIPAGESRGAHGHKELEQVVIAASGSFDITIDDGLCKKMVRLDRPYFGLNIKPGIWRDISSFSSGAICLVLASEKYMPSDYMYDYNEFIAFKKLP